MNEQEMIKTFYMEIMPMYIDSSKTYLQLAIGAVAFSTTFHEKVLGKTGSIRLSSLLICSWLAFLFTIAFSAWYQYSAVKIIESNLSVEAGMETGGGMILFSFLEPGYAYGGMVISFFVGAILLVASSAQQLLSRKTPSTT